MMHTNGILEGMRATAHGATETAGEMTAAARSGAADTAVRVAQVFATLRKLGVDDALSVFGLQRRRSRRYATMLAFGAGFFAGAATATLVAPMSGRATRRRISNKMHALLGSGAGVPTRDALESGTERSGDGSTSQNHGEDKRT